MSVVFVHDHKFRRIDGRIFSPGGLPNEVFVRYTKAFGAVTVIARIIDEDTVNPKYSEITDPKVTVLGRDSLEDAVAASDAVIARLPSSLGSLAVKEARKKKKPCLIEVAGCAWDAFRYHSTLGKLYAPVAYFRTKRQIRRATHVVYVTRDFLQRRYPTKGKSVNCSNVDIVENGRALLEKRLEKIEGSDASRCVAGTVGAVNVAYKGQRYVISALNESTEDSPLSYEMVGGGDPSELMSFAGALGVGDRVAALGVKKHEDVLEWLDGIDVYVQPSLTEGLSRALIEAMSRGLPCIATNVGGTAELIDEKWLVRADAKTMSRDIAAKLKEMTGDRSVLKEQAEKNFTLANKEYNRENIDLKRQRFFEEFKKSEIDSEN